MQNNVGSLKNFGPLGHDFRAFVGIVGVGIAGFGARTGLDDNFESGFSKVRNHRRHQRDAPLPRKDLARHTDNHAGPSFSC